MGNDFEIRFTSPLNNVGGTDSVNSNPIEKDVKVFNTNTSNPISNGPAYTDADLAEMWLAAGVEPTDAPEAAATTKAFAVMETAGFDIVELDELFAEEPEVVAHILTAYQGGLASRIERQNQSVATLIENLPEGTTEEEFEAFMYAFNVA
ncbi:hypothetical protein IKJ53_00315 [bacterium]|nr:hypothetical protein [bacterium]